MLISKIRQLSRLKKGERNDAICRIGIILFNVQLEGKAKGFLVIVMGYPLGVPFATCYCRNYLY